MRPATTHNLIQRLLDKLTSNQPAAPSSLRIDASHVSDPDVLQQDMEYLLNVPQIVGFSVEIASGSYLTRDVLQRPILFCRNNNGQLKAFLNACRHRGARVAEACGKASTFVCPFHGWCYDTDGELVGRRDDSAFDLNQDASLLALPVTEKAGLIILGLQHQAMTAATDSALENIEDELTSFNLNGMFPLETRTLTVKANWKLIATLSHEAYHFGTLHRRSVAEVLMDTFVVDYFGQHSRWAFPLKGIEKWAQAPKSTWPERFPGAVNHTLFPGNTVLITNPEDAQMIRVDPGAAPNMSTVHFTGLYRNQDAPEASREMFEFGYQVFTEEDLPIAESCQRGFDAGLPDMAIGSNEPVVKFWFEQWTRWIR